jgi:hypothetical protein
VRLEFHTYVRPVGREGDRRWLANGSGREDDPFSSADGDQDPREGGSGGAERGLGHGHSTPFDTF